MKGIDVTPEQIEGAKEFLAIAHKNKVAIEDDQQVSLPFGALARLLAWYGAMRYQAGVERIGSLEVPAPIESVRIVKN